MLNLMHKWAESLSPASNVLHHSPLSQSDIAYPLSLKWILENGDPLNLFQKLLSFCKKSDLVLVVGQENIHMALHFSMSPLPFLPRQSHKISTPQTTGKYLSTLRFKTPSKIHLGSFYNPCSTNNLWNTAKIYVIIWLRPCIISTQVIHRLTFFLTLITNC